MTDSRTSTRLKPKKGVKRFYLGRFTISWAAPGTIWWYNTKRKYRVRHDQMISLQRLYCREGGFYVWSFDCWRLKVMW